MARRREIQIFGISMLDTVTCGLGGAIVLMLFFAWQIPPQAEVVFDNASESTSEDTPTDGMGEVQINTGILTVFLAFDDAVDPRDHRPEACGQGAAATADEAERLTIARLGEAMGDALFEADPQGLTSFGYALWWRGPQAAMPYDCFAVPVTPACRFRYVAGAHYTEWQDCRGGELVYKRERNSNFFEIVP